LREYGVKKIPQRRDIFVWEAKMEVDLMQMEARQTLHMEKVDKRLWREDGEGVFSIKLVYMILQNNIAGKNRHVFKMLWGLYTTPRAQYLR